MTESRRRVLVVSYFYPPFRTVGGLRVSKHVKFLPEFGWDPIVLTADWNDGSPDLPTNVDEDAIVRVPQAFDITGLPRRVLSGRREAMTAASMAERRGKLAWAEAVYRQLLCIPDAQIGWRKPAIEAGRRIVRHHGISAILSSSLPNTSHLVASAIAEGARIPWVAELRDLWTGNHNFRRMVPLRALEARLERRVLRRADAVATVSEPWARDLADAIGRPVDVVENGFDPDDYPSGVPPEDRFHLAFTGMMYPGRQSARALLEAVRDLARDHAIQPDWFRITFTGQGLAPIAAEIDAAGVGAFASVMPPVAHHEALERQRSATALVFLDWLTPDGRGWRSAKIYEYAGAGRPILSLGPKDSAVAQLVGRARIGDVASTAEEARRILVRWVTEWRQNGALTYTPDELVRSGLERRAAVRNLAHILDRAASRRSGPTIR